LVGALPGRIPHVPELQQHLDGRHHEVLVNRQGIRNGYSAEVMAGVQQ